MNENATLATQTETRETVRQRPPLIPSVSKEVTRQTPLVVRLHVGREFMRCIKLPHFDGRRKAIEVYHLYPTLAEWVGRTIPDGVNPRSHEPDCLRSSVAKQIESTIKECGEDFVFANRGSTIVADSLEFDANTGNVRITIIDPSNEGLADGATTDAVIAKVQTQLAREMLEDKQATYQDLINANKERPRLLEKARIHLEVIIGLEDRTRIANLVQGRNTSRQVRGWSMADFREDFEWMKHIIDATDSPFKGKIGYEENSGKDSTILDVLSLLTLFHPEFDEATTDERAPVVAYSSKGTMDSRLKDPERLKGYKGLAPLLSDILKLHDHVYINFEAAYIAAFGGRQGLGKRDGIQSRLKGEPYELPLTGQKSKYILPAGYVYPILASLRALVYRRSGNVTWRRDPFLFFNKYGKRLVHELIEQLDAIGGNPNALGKRRLAYTAIHSRAQICLHEEIDTSK